MQEIKKINPIYLFFLILPILYALLVTFKTDKEKDNILEDDCLTFTVRTTGNVSLSLLSSQDTLTNWVLNAGDCKNLQYTNLPDDLSTLEIAVELHGNSDTVSFSGFHVYRNNQMYSLKKFLPDNENLKEENNTINTEAAKDKPFKIKLKKLSDWQQSDKTAHFYLLIVLIFSVFFITIIIIKPSPKYFVFSVLIALISMIFFTFIDFENEASISISSKKKLHGVELFYNHTPLFSPWNNHIIHEQSSHYAFQHNLKKNKFIRCDFNENKNIVSDLKVKFKTGFFYMTFNMTDCASNKIILNDIFLKDGSYIVLDNDPYLSFSTSYFVRKIKWLLFLEENVFFFLSCLFFLVLLLLYPFIGKVLEAKIRFFHLSYLLIVMSFIFLSKPWENQTLADKEAHFYFSARASVPTAVSLYNGPDSLAGWMLNDNSYKYLHFAGNFEDDKRFYLKIHSLASQDTFSLLSANYYTEGHVYNMFDVEKSKNDILNARLIEVDKTTNLIAENPDIPVIVKCLPVFSSEAKKKTPNVMLFVFGIFLAVFVVLLFAYVQGLYFVVVSVFVSVIMPVYFWLCSDIQWQVEMKTNSKVNTAQFFYNNNPAFIYDKKYDVNSDDSYFKTQIDVEKNPFLRCDFVGIDDILKNLIFSCKAGLYRIKFSAESMNTDEILLNDMLKCGDGFLITGDDPYMVYASSSQMQSLKGLIAHRKLAFLYFSIFVFVILILIAKYAVNWNLISLLMSVFFILVITISFLLRLVNSDSIILHAEMRYAHQMPNFKAHTLDDFMTVFDNYLKDQVPSRGNIIRINNFLEFSAFGELVDNPRVHFGKDGWLFYVGDACRENYENRYPLTNEELEQMKNILESRRNWLRERGMQFYIVFPPMAYFVYEDKVGPRMWRYNKESKVEQLTAYLKQHTDLKVVDVLSPLLESAKRFPFDLYFKTNSHWNFYGSYVAYTTLIKEIRNDFPELPEPLSLKDINWVDYKKFEPDLLMHLALEKFFKSKEYEPVNDSITKYVEPSLPQYNDYAGMAPPFCYENKKLETPSLLLYGDSYAGYWLFYLSATFSRSVYLFTPIFFPSVFEQEKPDIVIQEMNDYAIYNILHPNPPLPELVNEKPVEVN